MGRDGMGYSAINKAPKRFPKQTTNDIDPADKGKPTAFNLKPHKADRLWTENFPRPWALAAKTCRPRRCRIRFFLLSAAALAFQFRCPTSKHPEALSFLTDGLHPPGRWLHFLHALPVRCQRNLPVNALNWNLIIAE
ncbi:hypothetical protein J3E68DRAFT_409236 [Trichoderma sp. SZMC 28012]